MTDTVDIEPSDEFEDWLELAYRHAKDTYPHWKENLKFEFSSDIAWSNEGLFTTENNLKDAYTAWFSGDNPYSPFSVDGGNITLAQWEARGHE